MHRHHRIPHHLRLSYRHRRPLRPAHLRRLLLHPQRRGDGVCARAVRAGDLPAGVGAPFAQGRCEAVQDAGEVFCVGVCAWVDPADVVLWVCGSLYEYVGFPDVGEDGVDYGAGDGGEFG